VSCVDHFEMTRYGDNPQADKPLEVVLRNGIGRICEQPMGARELKLQVLTGGGNGLPWKSAAEVSEIRRTPMKQSC